ncbi:hypothetical protein [Diplocloster agilis]|uniref:Uncharacterized protein n=1 Tax=Diplocloster agilis TaxID=2850323 RepID=A0A949NAA9_9FIRM|nr:hypothetical protein [Diplocloster agilis]MBU9736277.1 hypothetical protein [Diplocloster agilis]
MREMAVLTEDKGRRCHEKQVMEKNQEIRIILDTSGVFYAIMAMGVQPILINEGGYF